MRAGPSEAREGHRIVSGRTGEKNGYEPPWWCWEPNPSPLQKTINALNS